MKSIAAPLNEKVSKHKNCICIFLKILFQVKTHKCTFIHKSFHIGLMPHICYGSPTEFGSSFLHKPCPPRPTICDFHLWLPETERELKSTFERVRIPNPLDQWCIHHKIHKKIHHKTCART